jgi:predicted transcriptional regulator
MRRRPLLDQVVEQMVDLHENEGLTYSQLAERFGTTRSAVSGYIWRHNNFIANRLLRVLEDVEPVLRGLVRVTAHEEAVRVHKRVTRTLRVAKERLK